MKFIYHIFNGIVNKSDNIRIIIFFFTISNITEIVMYSINIYILVKTKILVWSIIL